MDDKSSPEITPIQSRATGFNGGLSGGPSASRTSEALPRMSEQVDGTEDPNAKIASVKPVIDEHDRLWSEIDVLDDAAEMAEQTRQDRSFFGVAHAETLDNLRNAQIQLAQVMAETKNIHDTSEYRALWENDDIESLRRNLFDKKHFESMEEHVQDTLDKLEEVSRYMKRVDEQSREFWQSSE
jgi:hypothetical protein